MAHSQETRDKVRQLYIEGMPLNGAAVTCGVSYDTARDWKAKAQSRGDDWDTARAAYRIRPSNFDFLAINEAAPDSAGAEAGRPQVEIYPAK